MLDEGNRGSAAGWSLLQGQGRYYAQPGQGALVGRRGHDLPQRRDAVANGSAALPDLPIPAHARIARTEKPVLLRPLLAYRHAVSAIEASRVCRPQCRQMAVLSSPIVSTRRPNSPRTTSTGCSSQETGRCARLQGCYLSRIPAHNRWPKRVRRSSRSHLSGCTSWRLLRDGLSRRSRSTRMIYRTGLSRTVEGERAEVRYKLHTRNLQLIDFLRPLARALPRLTFTLTTLCVDDSSIESYRLRGRREQKWGLPGRRFDFHWERARKKFKLAGYEVPMRKPKAGLIRKC